MRRANGPGSDRVFLVFVLVRYPPLSPQGALGPRHRPAWSRLVPPGSGRGSETSWFLHTVLAKINIFHFGADSEKIMIFHFLLRSHVILLLLRYLIFQNPLFRRLFRFGPPLGPKKNRSIIFGVPWVPLWPPTALQGPPQGPPWPPNTLLGPPRGLPETAQIEK